VPVLAKGPYSGQIGLCGFVDVAASVADHLGVPSAGPGRSFI
jgi:phosphopentomutase